MREIKYRAWDKKKKEMEGDVDTWIDDFADSSNDKNLVFMQYTGLKDKNGKEIYEGDIVKYMKGEYQVGFYEAHFMIYPPNKERHEDLWKAIKKSDVEVVGNIYKK